MAEIQPKAFELKSQDGPVEVVDVKLHEDIRSDRDGRAHSHFSVSGAVKTAVDDFESITVGLAFALYDGDDHLGDAAAENLRLDAESDSAMFGPLEGPVTVSDARVSRLSLRIETSVVTNAARTVELETSDRESKP